MPIDFPPFYADLTDERLWNGAQPVHLTHKAWAVLRVLLDAHGRLVTKDQLAETVWHGTHVGDDSLTKVVRELRRALGDDPRAPRFIATVHGRGYRFVAARRRAAGSTGQPTAALPSAGLIGRDRQLSALQRWLDDSLQGQRQIGFVSGEVGIGKSSLVTALLAATVQGVPARVHVAFGQCVEQYGGAEPFLPVIAALRRCCRSAPSGAAILRKIAPSWLATACGLAPRPQASETAGVTRSGVLRTLAEVIEAIANEAPLVFVLEDLHWSDPSTLDLINLLARRAETAPLFVLCTLRHTDALAARHSSALLLRELRRKGLCREVALEGLARHDVDAYLAARLREGDPPPQTSEFLLRHTGGNPFFLAALVDDLIARGSLQRTGTGWELRADETPAIPSGSLAALAPRLERLSATERLMLEAASVAGDGFAAATVAAVIASEYEGGAALEEVEALCERLVRHRDILRAGAGGSAYAFRHALYRQALYEGIAPTRRRRMHRCVGKALAASRSRGSFEGAAEPTEHRARAQILGSQSA